MSRKLLNLAGVILTTLSFLFIPMTIVQAQTNDEVEIILHKRIIRDVDYSQENFEMYENDGKEIDKKTTDVDVITQTTPLNGAKFQVYDLTEYYGKANNGTAKQFVQTMAGYSFQQIDTLIEKEAIPLVGTIQTQDEGETNGKYGGGIGRIRLPRKSNAQDAVYLFVEQETDTGSGTNLAKDTLTTPLAVVLPIMDPMDTAKELQEIHLYPKNIGYLRDPYFFKYGRTKGTNEEGTPLAGAKFVLYKLEDGEKLYLTADSTKSFNSKWEKAKNNEPLTDENIRKYQSKDNGLVDTDGLLLAPNTYYFEEVQSVEGYEINEESKKIEVKIPASWVDDEGNETFVTVAGQKMLELHSGKVPEEAKESATPRVYNERQKTPTKDSEEPTNIGNKPPFSKFPQTGAVKTGTFLLGFMILVGVGYYLRRQKTTKKGS